MMVQLDLECRNSWALGFVSALCIRERLMSAMGLADLSI